MEKRIHRSWHPVIGIILAAVWIFWGSVGAAYSAAPIIDSAPYSGVAGYKIGIFGSNFGTTKGKVMINNNQATVEVWEDKFVEATIPNTSTGKWSLDLLTADNQRVSHPIEIYKINPLFLEKPGDLENVAKGKTVYLDGIFKDEGLCPSSMCFNLTQNTKNSGIKVKMRPQSTAAVDLKQKYTGEVWFSYFGNAIWWSTEPASNADGTERIINAPMDYDIETSNNSTDGVDGEWRTVLAVKSNPPRYSRIHQVTLSGENWIRMKVKNVGATGTYYSLAEIRVYKSRTGTASKYIDGWGFFGDSITAINYQLLGENNNVAKIIDNKRIEGSNMMMSVFGRGGQNARALTLSEIKTPGTGPGTFWQENINQAIAENPDIRYWAIGLGTNDSKLPEYTSSYKVRVKEGLDNMIGRGRVPVLARMPDTGDQPYGAGTPESKAVILKSIDELMAEYKLIPGPDLYTIFRRNKEVGGKTYFLSVGKDETHHNSLGAAAVNQAWAEAIYKSGIYGQEKMSGDANGDNKTDLTDFGIWKKEFLGQLLTKSADFNKDGKINLEDFGVWKMDYLE